MNNILTKEKLELLGLNPEKHALIDIIVENVLDIKGYSKTVKGKMVQVKNYQRKGDKKVEEQKGILHGITPPSKPTEKPKESEKSKSGVPPEATELMKEYKRILDVMKKMVISLGGIDEARNDPNYNALVEQQRNRRKKYDQMVNEARGKIKVEKKPKFEKEEERKPDKKGKIPETTPPEARAYLRMYKYTLGQIKKLQSIYGENCKYNEDYNSYLNKKKEYYAEYERLVKEYQVLNKVGKYANAILPYDLGKYNYKPTEERHWETLGVIQEKSREIEHYQNSVTRKYKDAKFEFNMPELIKEQEGLEYDNKFISIVFENEESISNLVKSSAPIEEYNKAIEEYEKSILDATNEIKSYEDRLANLTEGKESLIENKEVNMWGWNNDIDIYDHKVLNRLAGKIAQSSTKFKNTTNELIKSLQLLGDQFGNLFPELKKYDFYNYSDSLREEIDDIRDVADDLGRELNFFGYSNKEEGMKHKERKIKLLSAYYEKRKKDFTNELKTIVTTNLRKIENHTNDILVKSNASPRMINFEGDPLGASYKLQFAKMIEYLPSEYVQNIPIFTGKSEVYRSKKEKIYQDKYLVELYTTNGGNEEEMKRYAGFYVPSNKGFYTHNDASISITSHESAHAIHSYIRTTNNDLYLETLRMFTAAENKTKEWRDNITDPVDKYVKSSPYFVRQYGETDMGEHFATIAEEYFTNNNRLKQQHPDLYEFFHTKIMRKNENQRWTR